MKHSPTSKYALVLFLGFLSASAARAADALPAGRTITDVAGRSIEATVVEADATAIRILRKADDREFVIPIERLSQKDRVWVAEILEKQRNPVADPFAVAGDTADPAPPTLAPARPDPVAVAPDRPVVPPVQPETTPRRQNLPSADVIAAQERLGMVPPPLGWDALETTIRFKDGRDFLGYVYDVRGGDFWYAGRDQMQKKGRLVDLTAHCRVEIHQWRDRSIHAGSPSVGISLRGEKIHASIIRKEGVKLMLLTESGEIVGNVPVADLDKKGRAFWQAWQSGSWQPAESEWAIPPKFTAAHPFHENKRALAMTGKKWGVIDPSGSFVIEPRFDAVEPIRESGNVKIIENGRRGLLTKDLRLAVPPEWDDVGDLHQGMVPVLKEGKWGYVEDGGKPAIPCVWDDAWRFSQAGLAVVTLNGKRGFVDRAGKVVVKPEWDGAIMHSPEGIGAVRRGNGWALVDARGKLLCEPQWNFRWGERRFELGFIPAWPAGSDGQDGATLLGIDGKPDATPKLRDGVCLARQPGPYLWVESRRGRFIPRGYPSGSGAFDEIRPATGGMAAIRSGRKWGFANASGVVLTPQWDEVGRFSQGIAPVINFGEQGRSGIVNYWPWMFICTSGNVLIPPMQGTDRQYDIREEYTEQGWAPLFTSGRVVASGSHGRYWVDDTGREIHESIAIHGALPGQPFPKANDTGKFGLLNLEGRVVLRPEWDEIRGIYLPGYETSKRRFLVSKSGKWGLADADGNIVIEPEWEKITTYGEELFAVHRNGMLGLIGKDGNTILDPEWNHLKIVNANLIARRKGRTAHITDRDGKFLLEGGISVWRVEELANGSAFSAEIDGKVRYYWQDGTPVLPEEHSSLEFVDHYGTDLIFKNGPRSWWRACAATRELHQLENALRLYWNYSLAEQSRIWLKDKTTRKWHFCTIEGKHIGPIMESVPRAWFLDHGLGILWDDGKCRFIDKDGRTVGPAALEDARPFRHDRAAILRDGGWGFLDAAGNVAVPSVYDEVGDFFVASDDREADGPLLAAVSKDDRWGYIDPVGKLVIPMVGEARGYWSRSGSIRFPSREKSWVTTAVYDPSGNKVDPGKDRTSGASQLHQGKWAVFRGTDGKRGIVDSSGKTILEPRWRRINWLAPGIALVRSDHDGGLFSAEKGWIFRDGDKTRIKRRENMDWNYYWGESTIGRNHILIQETPKWGYARWVILEDDSLLAHYPLDGVALDSSGRGNHAQIEGAAWTHDKSGKPDSALYFDGESAFMTSPININPSALPELTMTAWVRPDHRKASKIFSHDNGGYDRSLGIDSRFGARGWAGFAGNARAFGDHPVEEGKWAFVAIVYNQPSGTVTLHVNDMVFEKKGNLGEGHDKLFIGKNPSFGEHFKGALDEIRIYNRALPPNEIADLYQKFLGGVEAAE